MKNIQCHDQTALGQINQESKRHGAVINGLSPPRLVFPMQNCFLMIGPACIRGSYLSSNGWLSWLLILTAFVLELFPCRIPWECMCTITLDVDNRSTDTWSWGRYSTCNLADFFPSCFSIVTFSVGSIYSHTCECYHLRYTQTHLHCTIYHTRCWTDAEGLHWCHRWFTCLDTWNESMIGTGVGMSLWWPFTSWGENITRNRKGKREREIIL